MSRIYLRNSVCLESQNGRRPSPGSSANCLRALCRRAAVISKWISRIFCAIQGPARCAAMSRLRMANFSKTGRQLGPLKRVASTHRVVWFEGEARNSVLPSLTYGPHGFASAENMCVSAALLWCIRARRAPRGRTAHSMRAGRACSVPRRQYRRVTCRSDVAGYAGVRNGIGKITGLGIRPRIERNPQTQRLLPDGADRALEIARELGGGHLLPRQFLEFAHIVLVPGAAFDLFCGHDRSVRNRLRALVHHR